MTTYLFSPNQTEVRRAQKFCQFLQTNLGDQATAEAALAEEFAHVRRQVIETVLAELEQAVSDRTSGLVAKVAAALEASA